MSTITGRREPISSEGGGRNPKDEFEKLQETFNWTQKPADPNNPTEKIATTHFDAKQFRVLTNTTGSPKKDPIEQTAGDSKAPKKSKKQKAKEKEAAELLKRRERAATYEAEAKQASVEKKEAKAQEGNNTSSAQRVAQSIRLQEQLAETLRLLSTPELNRIFDELDSVK